MDLAAVRPIRDQIRGRVTALVAELLQPGPALLPSSR